MFSKLILTILMNYKLHVLHNDFPLAPEKLAITYDMLSDYCKKITDEYEIKFGDVEKLVPNLGNKTNYMKKYIDFNTEKRTKRFFLN